MNAAAGRRLPVSRLALAIGATILVTGCGGSPARPPPAGSPAELAWIDNAAGLIGQLSDGVVVSAAGGSDLVTARRALDDESDLLAMVMASVAFGSCRESLRNVGVPTARLVSIETTLASACRLLQRASQLFTRAATHSDPRSLLLAAKVSERASPLLREAKAQLDEIRAELAHRTTP